MVDSLPEPAARLKWNPMYNREGTLLQAEYKLRRSKLPKSNEWF